MPTSTRTKRLLLGGIAPLIVGVAAFAAIDQLVHRAGRGTAPPGAILTRLVQPHPAGPLPLQVVVHDLLESMPGETAVQVCRPLASRPVQVTGGTTRLGDVLDDLAGQVGARLVVATSEQDGQAWPTIRCPDGPADYLTIGSGKP